MVASSTFEITEPHHSFYVEKGTSSVKEESEDRKGSTEHKEVPLIIVWKNVALIGYVHLIGLYGLYLMVIGTFKWTSHVITLLFTLANGFGITAGAHRLWAHRSYKAKMPLQILLAFMQTVACQNSIHEWCRDHRVHHKFTETFADPHNAARGFFFAHVGWLLCRKHSEVKTKGNLVDMSDLEANPVVMFQKKYFVPLTAFCCFILPTCIFYYVIGEDFIPSLSYTIARYIVGLNCTWLVNSAAHLWGTKPYDRTINPVENPLVSSLSLGEGSHNYHHVFPYDYKSAEFGRYKSNVSTAFIDFCAWLGLAYDLKTVSKKIIMQRAIRTGDGSHPEICAPWGWGDKDITDDMKEATEILYRRDSKSD